jgi:serine/threonine protein kinase
MPDVARVLGLDPSMSENQRARSPVAPGDVVGGKYRVEKVLGAGGMGVVVAATHVDLGQAVALKFILPELVAGKGAIERFMREARAAVRLKSEHVARVYDVGRDAADRPYMVLELLEGMDLARLNRQKGPLPVADAVEYVLQACEALVEAHALGLVHRDLKPHNIFVARRLNGTPLVKVLDFGIAKAIGPSAAGQMALTDSSAIIGSPLYMAPEQMRSARTADVRSDIWALGVILYELLGGQVPFDGETVTEVCIRVVNEEPERLVALRPALESSLVDVVMRCLEKDPEDRWQNVAQLASALEPYSRSAKHGGLVRPWRSFEDTHDSQGGGPPRHVLKSSPDDTGPSTAVTMPSVPPLSDAAFAEGGGATMPGEIRAGSDAVASGPARAGGNTLPSGRSQDGHPLVSTDVTWGDSTSEPGRARRPRSFTKGLLAGALVSFAAAAVVVGIVVGRTPGEAPGTSNASPPPSSPAPSAPVATAPVAERGPRAIETPPAEPAAEPASLPLPPPPLGPSVPRTKRRTPAPSVSARKADAAKTAPEAPAPAAAASSPPASPASPASPSVPNGAPILR